jgi:hypothetical protein
VCQLQLRPREDGGQVASSPRSLRPNVAWFAKGMQDWNWPFERLALSSWRVNDRVGVVPGKLDLLGGCFYLWGL